MTKSTETQSERLDLQRINGLAPPPVDEGYRPDLVFGIQNMPAARLLRIRVLGFSRAGAALLCMPVHPDLPFDGTSVQGGLVGTLADFAGVSASAAAMGDHWYATTLGFEVHNVAPARGQWLLAHGQSINARKSHAVAQSHVCAIDGDTAQLSAFATTTCKPFQLNAPDQR